MAKWGTYPPDEQLRLKRAAAEEMYEALVEARLELARLCWPGSKRALGIVEAAMAKARGDA